MGNNGSLNGEFESFRFSIEKVKNLLVDKFLFYGLIIAGIAVTVPLLPINTEPLSEGYYFDFINLAALAFVYFYRIKLSLSFKIGFIIIVTYSFFITNIY